MRSPASRLLSAAKRFGGFKFRRQHRIGRFIGDFVCLDQGLALEVDGNQHAEQTEYDERTNFREGRGLRVLRFSNREVLAEMPSVEEAIFLALTRPSLSPTLPLGGKEPEGEGE